jgi:hypothetical protein
MSRMTFAAAFIGACIFLGPAPVIAQKQAPPDPVNITTADGVRLKAMFYKGGADGAPTVIMLHPIGDGNGMKAAPEWAALAEKLQAKYSVIMFDFRGHGDSTTIDDEKAFWTKPANAKLVKSSNPKMKDTIDVKDYVKNMKEYLPVLVNDIAAVRAYLDRRNDRPGDCNTSSIFVIGAESGASLGALWINSEWCRYRYTPDPMYHPFKEILKRDNYTQCAGKDIIGAVFLNIDAQPFKRAMPTAKLLKVACTDNAMGAMFIFGKDDKDAATFNKNVAQVLTKKGGDKLTFIFAYDKLNTNLSGIKLLQKGLKTDEKILGNLDNVTEDRKAERVEREFPNTNYRWRMPNGATFAAREYIGGNPSNLKKGEKTLLWDDYNKFIVP